jgi:hypothetical protein
MDETQAPGQFVEASLGGSAAGPSSEPLSLAGDLENQQQDLDELLMALPFETQSQVNLSNLDTQPDIDALLMALPFETQSQVNRNNQETQADIDALLMALSFETQSQSQVQSCEV